MSYTHFPPHLICVNALPYYTQMFQIATLRWVDLSAENFLTTSLAHNKLKCGSFGSIVSLYNNSSLCKYQNVVYTRLRSVPRAHGHRRRRHWLIAASTIDWSNCAHSSIRRVLSSSASVSYFVVCYFQRRIFITTKLLNHVAPSVELVMRNVTCKSLEHSCLTGYYMLTHIREGRK